MPRQLTNDDLELLAEAVGAEMDDEPFDRGNDNNPPEKPKAWKPRLNPTQELAFNDPSSVVGLCSEKFSGKSCCAAEIMVRHCYMEKNALFTILGTTAEALKDGVCEDLMSFVLPQWREGNREPNFIYQKGVLVPNPKAGELMDNGMGLEYTKWKQDNQTKHIYLKIKNRYGGWSRIKVVSIPHPSMIDERIRGPAPSGIYLEEATKCKSKAYVTYPRLQLERRREITGPMQYIFSCNPEDKSNWVYKWAYIESRVDPDRPGRDWPKDPEQPGIRRKSTFAFYYLPYHENAPNVSQKNRALLQDELAADPILAKRLIHGKWMDYPSGEAIFKNEFSETKHMMGDYNEKSPEKSDGLLPVEGEPLIFSYDFGKRSVGTSIGQCIETDDGPMDLTVDELCYHLKKITERFYARALLEKLRYWNQWLRDKTDDPTAAWSVWHIAGDDATTVYQPNTGSTSARSLQDATREMIQADPERYAGIEPFVIRGCPRPPGSREARVDLVSDSLIEGRMLCSQICREHRDMFFHLERDKDNPNTPKGGTKHIHTFDALSYRVYYRKYQLPRGFYDLKAPTFSVSV